MNLERKVYETRSQKVGDFFMGVGLCIGLNVALGLILAFVSGVMASVASGNTTAQTFVSILTTIAYGLPCLLQIGLVIYFGLTRYWIALGMLGAIAFGLLLTLLLVAGCFVLIAGMSGAYNQ